MRGRVARAVSSAASGCDFGQGFLMGRPMPASELTALATREPVSRL